MPDMITEIYAADVDVLAMKGGAVLTILSADNKRYSVFVTTPALEKIAHRTKRELDRVNPQSSSAKDDPR